MGIRTAAPAEILPGTLDILILRVLVPGAQHGYGIGQRLKLISENVLQVGESSLYPALQGPLLSGWVRANWGTSDNNRRASGVY
jgi:PadR family transcriptional regulator PadR